MNRYTPLYSKIVDSSAWELPDHIRIVWITLLAQQDRDHVVRLNIRELMKKSNEPESAVVEALRVLSSPDERRKDYPEFGDVQKNEGRRIRKVADGWLILNGEAYQREMTRLNRREYHRRYKAERRKAKAAARSMADIDMPRTTEECVRAEMRQEVQERKEHVDTA